MKNALLVVLLVSLPLSALADVPSATTGMPNFRLTPGARNPAVTQQTIHQTICVPGYSRSIRPPERYTERLKRRQLREYGYADQRIWKYEEDHDLSLELGGSPTSPKNLWPEPRYGKWPAKKKDRLENELHYRVCHGLMSLHKAQDIITRHWTAGYKRYVAGRHDSHSHEWSHTHEWHRRW